MSDMRQVGLSVGGGSNLKNEPQGLTVSPSLRVRADEVSDRSSCRSHDLQILCRCLAFVRYFFVLNGLILIEGA
jgi:hypothetical protein